MARAADAAMVTAVVSVAALLILMAGGLALMRRSAPEPEAAAEAAVDDAGTDANPNPDDRDADATLSAITHARDAAEAANTTKSRYLVNVCHEMRSPLNAVYGYAQLLERGGPVDPVDTARTIRRCAEHLAGLVDGLVDISQIEHGTLRVASDTVRLRPFLDHVVNMFRNEAESKGLRFVCDLPEAMPDLVRMDEKRVRQILINLLSNAIKFTDEGEVRLRFLWSGSIARFEVSDTGAGIGKEELERIFQPFQRGARSLERGIPGAGLGLAITSSLVRMLGGELTVDSAPGEGTLFRLTMMLAPVTGNVPEEAPRAAIGGYLGARKRVLVVDDDIAQRTIMRRLLEELGFVVAVFDDGETALRQIAEQKPDIALLDVSMPGMSGWELSRRLRGLLGDGLRIIMLSGNALETSGPSDGKPVAHDLFLIKPVNFNALIDGMGRLLDLEWTDGAAGSADRDKESSGRIGGPLPEAAAPRIEEIGRLLRIGHLSRLEKEIKELAGAVPEADALALRLLDCLDRMDLATMRRLVKRAGAERK